MSNKILWTGLALILASAELSMAATSSACPGETGYYFVNYRRRNPTNGGFVSNEAYVDDNDYIFIAPTASVCGSSKITNNAKIYGNAIVRGASVSDNAEVFGDAHIENGAEVLESAKVNEGALVRGSVRISGKAIVGGQAVVTNSVQDELAQVFEDARVTGNARITGNAQVHGKARVMGKSYIGGNADVSGTAVIMGFTKLYSESINSGTRNDPDYEAIALEKKKAAEAEAARLKALQDERDRLESERKLKEKLKKDKADLYKGLMASVSDWLETKNLAGYQAFEAGFCRMKISFPGSDNRFVNADIYFNEEPRFKVSPQTSYTTIWIEVWDNWHKGGEQSILWSSSKALEEVPPMKADGSREKKNLLGSFALPIAWNKIEDARSVAEKFNKLYELCHESN